MAKKAAIRGSGRPKTGVVKGTIVLHPDDWQKASKIGKGKKSVGIRRALDKYDEGAK